MNAPLILIAEDAPDILMVLIELLEMEGYRVHSASDGKAAWDYLEACNQLPALLITDIMMPRMNGIELIHHIKADDRFKNIPCMAYSASVSHKQEVLKDTCCEFIQKPFDLDVITHKIKEVLQ